MNGDGFLMYTNGDKYEGSFVDDELEGEGTFISQISVTKAIWEKGKVKYIIDI